MKCALKSHRADLQSVSITTWMLSLDEPSTKLAKTKNFLEHNSPNFGDKHREKILLQ